MAMSPRMEPVQGDPNDPHTLLKAVFHYYCRFGRTGAKGRSEKTLGTLHLAPKPPIRSANSIALVSADSANFSKLCRDCPDLIASDFRTTDVDLIFIKAKKKGERRINYTRFLDALGMIAIQKYSDMVSLVVHASGDALQLMPVSLLCLIATGCVGAQAVGGALCASALCAGVRRRQHGEFKLTRLKVCGGSGVSWTGYFQVQTVWRRRAGRDDSSSSDLPPTPRTASTMLPPAPMRRQREPTELFADEE